MRVGFLIGLGFALLASRLAASEPVQVTVLYDPVYTQSDGEIAGPIASPAMRIFTDAGISVTWVPVPASRAMALIRANSEADCTPGWYKTPERAAYARFTLPIHIDKALLGLVRADYRTPDSIDAKDLLARPRLHLGVKQGYSYGPFLDELIAKMPARNVSTLTGSIPAMVKMVHSRYIDMMIVMDEEAESFILQAGYEMKDFRLIAFPDAPQNIGNAIMCSEKVPPEIIDRLDAAIRNLRGG